MSERVVVFGGGNLAAYALGPDVTIIIQDETARVVDLNRGVFYGLNDSATRLLMLILEIGLDAAVCRVADEYDIDQKRVRSDCDRMLRLLFRKRVLVRNYVSQDMAVPGLVRLWVMLTCAWISIRLLGLARTVRVWRWCRKSMPDMPVGPHTATLIERLGGAVCMATSTHFLNSKCKERSLVAWHILRNKWGLPAELVIGIMPFPFAAHAWVECGSTVVTDSRSHCDPYTPAVRFN